jgi:putative DNA primase/helicase
LDLTEHKTVNRAGFKKCENEDIEFFVFPETFKTEIAKGFNSTLVAEVYLHHQLLRGGSNGEPTRSERLPGMAKSTRVYRFTSAVLTE